MSRVTLRIAASFLFAALLWGDRPADAQTVTPTSGAINGRVADNTGAVLPGVTVSISSPALMGTRSATTNEEGFYRFSAVPPGVYTVLMELVAFTSVARSDIEVRIGFTATVNVEMSVASLQESITIRGSSPVVDTQSTAVASTFDAQKLKSLPFTAEYWALLSVAPAVQMARADVGGSESMNNVGNRVYGSAGQGRGLVEGIVATWGTGQVMYYTDPGSFSEVALNTVSPGAEAPTPGVYAQLISKSGGNSYHGSLYFDYEDGDWSTRNIDSAQLARAVRGDGVVAAEDTNRLLLYRRGAADIGGYVVKDRLWWYYGFSHLRVNRRLVDTLGVTQSNTNPTHSTKVTFKPTLGATLIGYYQGTRKTQIPYVADSTSRAIVGSGAISEPGSGWKMAWGSGVWKAEWNQAFTDNLFVEARVGNWWSKWTNAPMSDDYRYEDIVTAVVSGHAHGWDETRARPQVLGSMNYFKTGWGGSHNIKVGGELARESIREDEKGYLGNIAMLLRSGRPDQVMLFDGPNTNDGGLWHRAVYVTDTWHVGRRLTLNLGLRYDGFRSFLPAQEHRAEPANPTAIQFQSVPNLVTWNHVMPRLGAIYDPFGTGKTALKFHYGTYTHNPSTDLGKSVNPNQSLWSYRYTWNDSNGDLFYQPGEEGVLLATNGGVASVRIDPALKNAYSRQVSAFVEHQIAQNFGVRTGVVWIGDRNPRTNVNENRPYDGYNVPVTVRDPGPDGIVGSADDGGTLTAWNLAAPYVGLPTVNVTKNLPTAKNDYYTFEMTGDKRMSNSWSLLASFAHTWSRAAFLGAATNPNLGINRADGRDHSTSWQAKLSMTLALPKEFRVSPLVRHQAGPNFGRTFVAPLNFGSTTLLAEPFNSQRTRNVTLVDMRIEKSFTVAKKWLPAAFFDLYNILNTNAENAVISSSGSSWLRPTTIVSPRIVKLGVKLDW